MHLSASNQVISRLSLHALYSYEWEFWAQQPLDIYLNIRGLGDGWKIRYKFFKQVHGKMD